ncbi:hypothetical protein EV714DRAFT_212794 [Schizophyllum commune]
MPITTIQVYQRLGAYDLHVLRNMAIQVAVGFFLYGVQLTLSIAAIAILARRHGRSDFTLVAIFGLLLSSTVYTVADEIFYLVQFPVNMGTSERAIDLFLDRLDILLGVSKTFNLVLSDAVLIWRAWCLWPSNCLIKGTLSLCIGGSIAGAVAELTWAYWPSPSFSSTLETHRQYLVRFIPLLVTNVVATVLIGTKVLQYRREIKGSLGFFTQSTQVGTVLLLLLDSGIAYILFWVADCILAFSLFEEPFHILVIFTAASPHIAGIYPTCVLFVAIRGTTESLISGQVSQAMRFGDPPAAPQGARAANTTSDFHLNDSVGALYSVSQDSRMDNHPLAGSTGTRHSESIPASSEGIIEVDRESTAM